VLKVGRADLVVRIPPEKIHDSVGKYSPYSFVTSQPQRCETVEVIKLKVPQA